MRIAGVTFASEPRGPEGHSDGDAALHAIVDALLGAAAAGDIGSRFPPDDPQWAGTDSATFVQRSVEVIAEAGWRPASVDLSIATASPAIAPRREEIVGRIAELAGLPRTSVSVKGTTSDGLGFAGADGLAAWAVAVVEPTT